MQNATTNLMQWSSSVDAYVGETADGREVRVDGDEISESLADAAKADGVDLDALFETDRDAYNAAYARYRDMQLDPEDWAGLDSDGNESVKTFCARCGHLSAADEGDDMGDELVNDGDGNQWYEHRYCDCACHEEGIALGREN